MYSKDGTEGTYDYRPLSAIYLILKIALGLAFVKLLVPRQYKLFEQMVGLLYKKSKTRNRSIVGSLLRIGR